MKKPIIKNIMWDVDGVLANLDHAYFRLLTEHPNYAAKYKGLKWQDLPSALPISPEYGALELRTHPEIGAQLNHDFCHNSGDIYFDRPLYPHVAEVLADLNSRGYFQLTMSAGFDSETKKKMIADTLCGLDFVHIEVVQHAPGKTMVGEKEARIKECLAKYNLKAEETVLVDDRIFNCRTALALSMRAVRCTPGFTLPTPPDIKFDAEVANVLQFRDWLLSRTSRGEK